MNTVARLLLFVCAVAFADASAADPNANAASQPPSQPALPGPAQAAAQAAAGPRTTVPTATPDPSLDGKADTGSKTSRTAESPATASAPPVASKSGRKVLVDDTINDAQLKQLLARGYKPENQARGNEVYYCRSEQELGSRFEEKVCKTAARILQEEQLGKEATTNVERTGPANRALK